MEGEAGAPAAYVLLNMAVSVTHTISFRIKGLCAQLV